jgi:hypothetical protein
MGNRAKVHPGCRWWVLGHVDNVLADRASRVRLHAPSEDSDTCDVRDNDAAGGQFW